MDETVRVILLLIAATAGLCAFALIHATVRVRWLRGAPTRVTIPSRHDDHVPWHERASLLLIVCASAAIHAPWLTRGLDYDELYTASRFVVGVPLGTAASSVRTFNNHVAYSLLANLGVRLLGPAEWVVRLPAFLMGLGAVYMLWRFARTWSTPSVALLSAATLALSPFFGEWTRSARGYTGLALMMLISSHTFFQTLRDGSPRTGVRHVMATALAMYFHLYGAWVALVQYAVFLYVVFARRRRQRTEGALESELLGLRLLWRSFVAVPLIIVILYLPLALPLATQLARRGIAQGPTAVRTDLAVDVLRAYAGVDAPLLVAAAWLLAVLGLAFLASRGLMAGYLVALIVVPFVTMSLLIRPFDLYTRFFVYWAPIFAYLVGSGITGTWTWVLTLSRARTRVMGLTAATALSLATTFLAVSWLRADLRPAPQGGYRESLRVLRESPVPSVTVGGDSDMFDYYLGKPQTAVHSVADLERFIGSAPSVLVAYHNVDATEDARDMAALLKKRCALDERGVMMLFRCDR